jgi:HEAT repeat protein
MIGRGAMKEPVAAAHWIKSAILAMAAGTVVLAPTPVPAIAQTTPPPVAQGGDAAAVQRDLELQERSLRTSPDQLQREEAARKLVSRDAEQALMRVLVDGGSRDVQLAVAKALALDATPNTEFIPLLSQLLGQDAQLTDAAAQALATFKNVPQARDPLTRYIRNLDNGNNRRFVARALGRLVDKEAAFALIQLLRDENQLVRDAAADGLEQMTGESFGTDPQRWGQWWNRVRAWEDAEWAQSIAQVKSAQFGNRDARLQSLRDSVYKHVRQSMDANRGTATADLLRLMSDQSDDMRTVAVQIVADEVGLKATPPEVAEQLRKMVGDSSPLVRERVALTLGAINDPAALDALLTQAAQERDPDVLAAIVSALGPAAQFRGDFETVKRLLLASLDHESFAVSRAAAESFKALAGLLRDPKNQESATFVATSLQNRLRGTDKNVAALKLRESLVEALAELAHPSSRNVFQQLLNQETQSPFIRIWALRGLLNVAGADAAQSFVDVLNNDPDRGVRHMAATALLTAAGYANIHAVYPRLGDREPDPSVRKVVWDVMTRLFEQATPDQLEFWVQEFKKGPPELSIPRRLTVLTILERKLAEAGKDAQDLAVYRQNLGEVMLLAGKPEEASIKFLQALEYWKQRNAPEFARQPIVIQTMTALLQAKKDAEAVAFATEAVTQNPAWEGGIWTQVKNEVERRQKGKDVQGALALVREARKVPWPDLRSGQLAPMEQELQRLLNEGGGGSTSRIVHEPKIYEHAAMRVHTG